MELNEEPKPFYGYEIIKDEQQEIVNSILSKYKREPVTEALKQKIWDELQLAKYNGLITIPFKVALRRDPSRKFPDYVEVILDTKL